MCSQQSISTYLIYLYLYVAILICKPPFYLTEWSLVVAEKFRINISQAKIGTIRNRTKKKRKCKSDVLDETE